VKIEIKMQKQLLAIIEGKGNGYVSFSPPAKASSLRQNAVAYAKGLSYKKGKFQMAISYEILKLNL